MFSIDKPVVTMTSLELVDFINQQRAPGDAELRHDHFMAKVPKVLGNAAPKFLGTAFYTNGTGAKVQRDIYRFPKREACLMAMSYSYDLQAKVFDRMTELEMQVSKPAPAFDPNSLSRMDILKLAMESEQGRLEAEAKLVEQAPKVQYFDDIISTDGTMSMAEVAKPLGIGHKTLFDYLRTVGVLCRDNLPKQTQIECGRFRVVHKHLKYPLENPKVVAQTRVTPKGVAYIHSLLRGANAVQPRLEM